MGRSRAPADRAGHPPGRRVLAPRGRRREGLRRGRSHLLRRRLRRAQRVLLPHGEEPRVLRRAHDRDRPRLPLADGPRSGRGLPVRPGPRRLRPVGALRRRLLPEQAGLRRAPQLPGHHAQGAPRAGPGVVAETVGGGSPRRALLQARARRRQPRDHPGRLDRRPLHRGIQHLDAPRRRRQGNAALPSEDEAAHPLEPPRPDQGRLLRRKERPREAAPDRAGHGTHRHADDPSGRDRQPLRGLGPGGQHGQGVARAGLREARASRHEGHERAGARHPLRDAPEDVSGGAHGGSVLADGADPDRAALRREPPDPRGAGQGDARGSPLLAARAASRGAHREPARPAARAFRRLVQRLQAARAVHRGTARRHRQEEVPLGGGLPGRHPQHPRQAGLLEGPRRLPGFAHPRRSRRAARATPPAPPAAPTRRISARASRRTG